MADMQLNIRHETIYRYDETVTQSVQMLRLTPRTEARQRTMSWQIVAPGRRSGQLDAHGNHTHLLTLEEPHQEIRIVVSGSVETRDLSTPQLDPEPLSPLVYLPSTALTTPDAALRALAERTLGLTAQSPRHDRKQLTALAEAVCEAVRYQSGTTTVTDTAASALKRAEGVCQDQAHVFIACCRLAGVPARYVSGYLYAGENQEVASHAWVDAWLESERAWIGIDVTHHEPAGPQHCRLAVGRDYHDAAPVRGVRRGGGKESLEVNVSVSLQHSAEQ
jgi:transglutaminase-like putative cysteine protease